MTSFSPREIVSELDRFIVGQHDAKRAVAIALRNRWRRQQLPEALREEVLPKNILMIGPTGVGKTEIARRLAKLAQAPFLKVEATKFTEVGYVGRDVEQIVRDLVEIAITMTKDRLRKEVESKAELRAEDRVLDALVGTNSTPETRQKFRKMLREGTLNDREIEIQVADTGMGGLPTFDMPGMPGAQMGMLNLNDIFGKAFGGRTKTRRMAVSESYEVLMAEECDKLLDQEKVVSEAIQSVEQNGIVFLDEIDKISARTRRARRRRCQPRGRAARPAAADRGHLGRDQARHGQDRPHPVHRVGRLPHRQAVGPAARASGPPADPGRAEGADAGRLPPHPDRAGSQPDQAVQGAAEDRGSRPGLHGRRDRRACAASPPRSTRAVENIGARRLHTVMERLLEEISFNASDRGGTSVTIDAGYVREHVSNLAKNADLSKFIL